MGRLQVQYKDVGGYDCDTCMDLGHIYDTDDKRNRPCPDCFRGRGTY